MKNAFDIVKNFEQAVCEYTGAPYAVAVNSCTNALFLALKFQMDCGDMRGPVQQGTYHRGEWTDFEVEIPNKTYLSVPMQIKHAGMRPVFRDEEWKGIYQLKPFNIWDAARRFTSNMFKDINFVSDIPTDYVCVSFHWSKILGVQQGGMILHNDYVFDQWARKARFDGRTEGVAPKDDNIDMLGWHMYMSPEVAAEGLVRLMHLPKHNADLPNDDYPDLSQMDIFK